MKIILFVFMFFLSTDYGSCLRNVRLIFPKSVPDGGIATLFCLYDLESEPLYSIKWYRGNYEIYRYLPKEKPKIRVFSLPGLYIDINSSNSHRLTLLDVPKYLGGNFTCEVSSDEPRYATRFVTQFLLVTPRNKTQVLEDDYNVPNESYTKLTSNNLKNEYLNTTSKACFLYVNYFPLIVVIYVLHIK